MLELLLCSAVTILPDFLYRRFAQGKRLGREITLFSVWYELRWGITLCVILTISLITTIFYFHPSTSSAVSVFRTVTILPETNGRVAETFVGINQHVTAGQPLFRLDATEQEAAIETAKRKIAEVEADMVVAQSQLAEAEGRIAQARGSLKQADDEYQTRAELMRRNANAISQREIERAQVAVDTAQGAVDAALAGKARRPVADRLRAAGREGERRGRAGAGPGRARQDAGRRRHRRHRPAVRAAARRRRQPDDPPRRHPRARRATRPALIAGFGQIEAQVMKVGMIGEVDLRRPIPFTVIPMVVTEVQDVIASGQIRPTDQLSRRRSLRPARARSPRSSSRSSRAS